MPRDDVTKRGHHSRAVHRAVARMAQRAVGCADGGFGLAKLGVVEPVRSGFGRSWRRRHDFEKTLENLEAGVEFAQRRQEGWKQVQAVAEKISNLTVALAPGR